MRHRRFEMGCRPVVLKAHIREIHILLYVYVINGGGIALEDNFSTHITGDGCCDRGPAKRRIAF
jgi:hypothetical protein